MKALKIAVGSMVALVFVLIVGFSLFGTKHVPEPTTPTELVYNDPLDNSVQQVERHLEKTLNNPDSYEAVEWSKVFKNHQGNYIVRHKYRASNTFGGVVTLQQTFVLDSAGTVVEVN